LASHFLEAGCFVKNRPDVEFSDSQLFLFGNLAPENPEAGTPTPLAVSR
jgi:choline dehydrogenase